MPPRKRSHALPTSRLSSSVNLFRPHPWHGLVVGPDPPEVLNASIEITPFDLMKYEVDKVSGYLRVDRPQRSSAQHPTLYGFVPRTYCDERVRRLAPTAKRGDGDPLDICVLSERAIARNEIIVRCRVIGGLQMIDGGEADDKIISVLENDYVWGGARNVSEVPSVLVERLQHYFLTYKLVPGKRARASAYWQSVWPDSRPQSRARRNG
jgi:inorganic pyrophosphatase